jgi:hypothetical protein
VHFTVHQVFLTMKTFTGGAMCRLRFLQSKKTCGRDGGGVVLSWEWRRMLGGGGGENEVLRLVSLWPVVGLDVLVGCYHQIKH